MLRFRIHSILNYLLTPSEHDSSDGRVIVHVIQCPESLTSLNEINIRVCFGSCSLKYEFLRQPYSLVGNM